MASHWKDLAFSQIRYLNKNLFIASHSLISNYFYFVKKLGYKNYDVLARIYKCVNDWYIWYEKECFSVKIYSKKPFSYALERLEKEFDET